MPASLLGILVNVSLSTGTFSDKLKIVPIYKSDDKLLVNNYRPISVLPFFSKIHERLLKFLNDNNILINNQHSFREGHYVYSVITNG